MEALWWTIVRAGLITPTSRHRLHHRLNTPSPLTSALGSEALYEAGVQVSRGQWLLFSENLLAGYVWLQADWRLPPQEVQHRHRGDHEPGRDRFYGGWQGLQGKHQEWVSVCRELARLLSHGPCIRWVKDWSGMMEWVFRRIRSCLQGVLILSVNRTKYNNKYNRKHACMQIQAIWPLCFFTFELQWSQRVSSSRQWKFWCIPSVCTTL